MKPKHETLWVGWFIILAGLIIVVYPIVLRNYFFIDEVGQSQRRIEGKINDIRTKLNITQNPEDAEFARTEDLSSNRSF